MSLIGAVKNFLAGKGAVAQLAEVRDKLAAATAEIERLDGEIARRALPVMRGDLEAARVRTELLREKQQLEDQLGTLRHAEAALAATVAAEAEAARRAEAAALPGAIAADCAALLALDDDIDGLARQLADAMRERIQLGEALAAKVGSEVLRRSNTGAARRIRSAIAQHFMIDKANANTEVNNLLQLRSDEVGDRAWLTLRQHDAAMFDDEAPFYPTAEAAQEAQARLAARNTETIVQAIGAAWTVTRTDCLFATRPEAEAAAAAAARAGRELAILAHGPGFVLRPARFADSAILAAE